MPRHLIIGNGTAGFSAIQAILEYDSDGEITVISLEHHLPYSRVLLTHYIGGHVSKDNLYMTGESFFKQKKVNLLLGAAAVNIDPEQKRVELDNGRVLSYEKLLVATGGKPVIPQHLQKESPDIMGLRTIEDASYIRQKSLSGAKIVIVGGGSLGVELACALREGGNFPEMVVSSSHVLSRVADDEAAAVIQEQIQSYGIKIWTGEDVTEVVHTSKGVEGVVLSGGQEISCQVVVICKGVQPNREFLDRVLPTIRGGIKVDSNMRTDIPDVYAAGDVVEAYELSRQEFCVSAIWPHAIAQGRVAGMNMTGQDVIYEGSLSRNALEIFGLPVISMGITRVPAKRDWDLDVNQDKSSYCKLVYHDAKLVGAVLVGKVEKAGKLQAAIRKAAGIETVLN